MEWCGELSVVEIPPFTSHLSNLGKDRDNSKWVVSLGRWLSKEYRKRAKVGSSWSETSGRAQWYKPA